MQTIKGKSWVETGEAYCLDCEMYFTLAYCGVCEEIAECGSCGGNGYEDDCFCIAG
jgi:hypothetical protein